MVSDHEVTVTVCDRAWRRMGWVTPSTIRVTLRHLGQGDSAFTIPATHRRADDLMAQGARVAIWVDGHQVMSGPVKRIALNAVGPGATDLTVNVSDWWCKGAEMLAWPDPGAPLASQPKAYTVSGAAETAVKGVIGRNAARLGLPIDVAPDLGRGSSLPATDLRFAQPWDKLPPLLKNAGIGVTLSQQGTRDNPLPRLLLDVYEQRTYPFVLTPDSGVVLDWEAWRAWPKRTRTVVGGEGRDDQRTLRAAVATDTEAAWGDVIEDWLDETNLADVDKLDAAAAAKNVEEAASSGFTLTMSSAAAFGWSPDPSSRRAMRLGDVLRFDPTGSGRSVISDVLSQVVVNYSPDKGFEATPSTGDSDGPVGALYTSISDLYSLIRARKD